MYFSPSLLCSLFVVCLFLNIILSFFFFFLPVFFGLFFFIHVYIIYLQWPRLSFLFFSFLSFFTSSISACHFRLLLNLSRSFPLSANKINPGPPFARCCSVLRFFLKFIPFLRCFPDIRFNYFSFSSFRTLFFILLNFIFHFHVCFILFFFLILVLQIVFFTLFLLDFSSPASFDIHCDAFLLYSTSSQSKVNLLRVLRTKINKEILDYIGRYGVSIEQSDIPALVGPASFALLPSKRSVRA